MEGERPEGGQEDRSADGPAQDVNTVAGLHPGPTVRAQTFHRYHHPTFGRLLIVTHC